MEIRVDYIGRQRSPVVVIEGLWPDPHALVDIAAARTDYSARSLYYPGLRSSAPPDYAHRLNEQLQPVIESLFGLRGKLTITDSTFSLVVTAEERLVAFQRVPHFDSTDPNRIAVLHYLCGPEHGGTSFYRHRSSGTEVVTEENRERYIKSVNAEVKEFGMPPLRYVDGETRMFEHVVRYDCEFNRALIYRGNALHSVNTARQFRPDPNPRTGRLTVNTFLLAEGDQTPVQ